MTLTPGSRFGPYEIVDAIGAGGMGEVYRARDTRLDRLVALKVLPQAFTRDSARLGRFEREAKVLRRSTTRRSPRFNLWLLSTSDRTWRQVTDFGEQPTVIARQVSWSPDDRHLYAAISKINGDVVMLDGLV